ncbi:hypothetical protein MTO96_036267 [Rhipicephalus appendiculatus]
MTYLWHVGVAPPRANQKRRTRQKATPKHDSTAKWDGPSWLIKAENGGPSSQRNDKAPGGYRLLTDN